MELNKWKDMLNESKEMTENFYDLCSRNDRHSQIGFLKILKVKLHNSYGKLFSVRISRNKSIDPYIIVKARDWKDGGETPLTLRSHLLKAMYGKDFYKDDTNKEFGTVRKDFIVAKYSIWMSVIKHLS